MGPQGLAEPGNPVFPALPPVDGSRDQRKNSILSNCGAQTRFTLSTQGLKRGSEQGLEQHLIGQSFGRKRERRRFGLAKSKTAADLKSRCLPHFSIMRPDPGWVVPHRPLPDHRT